MIRFLLNDDAVSIETARPDQTVLNYLREQRRLTGTKEGCASGDCGACTVVIAEPNSDGTRLRYRAINSCVTFLSALHGKQLLTVEHLAEGEQLHPVQQAMVDHHASQCGFCTPGFVMSMFALYHDASDSTPDRDAVNVALSGNLCRCTGYRPIVEAAMQVCGEKAEDRFTTQQDATLARLRTLCDEPAGIEHLHLPRSRAELTTLRQQKPDARLFAGSTDLALEVTQRYQSLDELICLSHVPELTAMHDSAEGLWIGAAVSMNDLKSPLLARFPALGELLSRFASAPIRNQATLGGNIANASPIGDMPPVLLALDASIDLDNGTQRRRVPAHAFFTGYRKTVMAADEWIEGIWLPTPSADTRLAAYKVSKRHEDDISAVCAVFAVTVDDAGAVCRVRTGFGGVAATPVSATAFEAEMTGVRWADPQTASRGSELLAAAFNPIDDVRASAAYRKRIAANLWQRFWMEQHSLSANDSADANRIATRVIHHA